MTFPGKIEARELVGALSLSLALVALLWAPFEWINAFMTDSPDWAANKVAQRTRYLWPVLVGTGLAGGYLGYRARSWVAGFLAPCSVLVVLVFIFTVTAYLFDVAVILVVPSLYLIWLPLVVWYWGTYRIARLVIEKYFRVEIGWQNNFANRSALFGITTVPQVLCLFGLWLNIEWYFDFI